jgi:RimJ/RimL family protein N-acetyltransferase
MQLEQLAAHHLPALRDISSQTDEWLEYSDAEFYEVFSQFAGWAILHDGLVIGYIVLSDYKPYRDLSVHCSVLPEYRTKWLTKGIYKTVFNTIFDGFQLPRCTSWTFGSMGGSQFLERLGFKYEGTVRNSYIFKGEWIDTHLYGMLPNERKFK